MARTWHLPCDVNNINHSKVHSSAEDMINRSWGDVTATRAVKVEAGTEPADGASRTEASSGLPGPKIMFRLDGMRGLARTGPPQGKDMYS